MVVEIGAVGGVFKVYAHGRGCRAGRKGLPSFSQRQDLVEQISLTFQFHVTEVFTRPVSAASSSHSPGAVDEALQWVFARFSKNSKSASLGPHSGSELGADFIPWTPAACGDSMALEDDESETELESRSEVEEDAATRFGAGFSAFAGLHAVPGAPHGSAGAGVCLW